MSQTTVQDYIISVLLKRKISFSEKCIGAIDKWASYARGKYRTNEEKDSYIKLLFGYWAISCDQDLLFNPYLCKKFYDSDYNRISKCLGVEWVGLVGRLTDFPLKHIEETYPNWKDTLETIISELAQYGNICKFEKNLPPRSTLDESMLSGAFIRGAAFAANEYKHKINDEWSRYISS